MAYSSPRTIRAADDHTSRTIASIIAGQTFKVIWFVYVVRRTINECHSHKGKLAARPEFGPFSDEIRRIGRELMTGKSFTSSLAKTNQRIKSEILNKTIDLMIKSVKSGGKLADLLDHVSADIRDQQIHSGLE